MKARNNNGLRRGALFSLFVTSCIPLFAIVIGKQINDEWEYVNWGGWNEEALWCFATHFGMSLVLFIISIVGCVGSATLLNNLKKNLNNGITAKVVKISNRKCGRARWITDV